MAICLLLPSITLHVITWWMRSLYSTLRQWAFDILTIPATYAEIEIFSQARRLITDDRNSLSVKNIVEILLCYKHWMKQGLITSLFLATYRMRNRCSAFFAIRSYMTFGSDSGIGSEQWILSVEPWE